MDVLWKFLLVILLELGFRSSRLDFVSADSIDVEKANETARRRNAAHAFWPHLRKQTITVLATQKIHCFECDSRKDEQCAENVTSLMLFNKGQLRIKTVLCNGSCVKMVVNETEAYVRRSCTRNSWISQLTTLSDSVCMGNSSNGENEVCICFKNYCNGATQLTFGPAFAIGVLVFSLWRSVQT